MVFLESAGRPDAIASDDLEGAVGLTQILAETATSLLGMRVDVAASERLTKRIRRARATRRRCGAAQRLRAQRRTVDERFDPDKALAGTGRYLRTALDRFDREDLAVVSYHMGIGNLESALDAYGDGDVSYAQLYFDSTPLDTPQSQRILAGLGDDSSTYLWRVLAAVEIMRLYRGDQERAAAPRRAADRQGVGGGGAAPARPDHRLHDPGRARRRLPLGRAAPVPQPPARPRPAPRPAHGRARAARGRRARASTAACGPRPTRWRSTSARACARSPAPRRR